MRIFTLWDPLLSLMLGPHGTTPHQHPPESNSESSQVFVTVVSRDLACFVLTQLYSFLTSGSEPGALAPASGPQEPSAFVFLV